MSARSVRCPGCQERLAVPPHATGRLFHCPRCRAVVGVAEEGNTVIDGEVPDFSYLKKQAEQDDDILASEDPDEQESALGETTSRPAPKPVPRVAPPPPAPVLYTPPSANTDNPFAAMSERQAKPRPGPLPADEPPPKARDRRDPPPVVRTPAWAWPVLIALAVYAAVATGAAAWGWLRPVAPAPISSKLAK